ncbi:MAG: DUF308 domain-containing protein [Bacteroidota bacterium]
MVKSVKTNWWLLLIVGIIFIILSVKVMMHPEKSLIGLAFIIGWASLMAGIFQIGFAISTKSIMKNWTWRLFSGLINVVIGVIFLSHPAVTAKVLPFIFGFWMIFIGITTFFAGIREQNSNVPGGWFEMLLGVIIFIGGMSITYNPAEEASMLIWFVSFSLMFYGIYLSILSLQLSRMK